MKFEATVLEWGGDALMFLEDANNAFVVLFGDAAPAALRDMAIIHNGQGTTADPAPGDTLTFGDLSYKITAVGEEAKVTLKELGHCTLKFKAASEPDLPGCIHLDGPTPSVSDIKEGMKITIG